VKLQALVPFLFSPPASIGKKGKADSTQASPTDSVTLSGTASSKSTSKTRKNTLSAPPSRNPEVEVKGRFASEKWAWTEHLFDSDKNFKQQNFHSRGHQKGKEVVAAFGTSTPHSGSVLLHHAGEPPAGVARQPHPVVLVHGANKNGEFWWDPKEDGSDEGLPQRLREQGFDVYAVSFAHPHDDNFFWAEQLANSIDRVKQLTGAEQVDVVAHSKGGAPARAYVSDMRQDWMTPYQGDVRRLVLVGAANGGLDTSFRHSASNMMLMSPSNSPLLNAPMSWEGIKVWGVFPVSTKDNSYSNEGRDNWPGQDQLLARWDSKYPIASFQPDWYTTYNGGPGFISNSKGIDHYIAQGGHYIEKLNNAKIDPEVEVALLAGNNPNIPGILNESAGPSDGLLLLDSALHMPSSNNIKAKAVLHLNHKDLVAEAEGQEWIADILKKD